MEESPEVPPVKTVTKEEIQFSRIKRRVLKHVWLVRIGMIAGVVLGLYLIITGVNFFARQTGLANFFEPARLFLTNPAGEVKQNEGRTNILILGKGGLGHDAPDLTDSIIFASVGGENLGITTVSLPRDIWVPAIRAKLNSAYYWGNQKSSGGGIVLAKSTVEEIAGQPVHYAIVFDFSIFKNIVDALGGIEVEVAQGFTDKKYPIPGKENDLCQGDREYKCRYETITFSPGKQLMDGETALKFVRSRNAEGDEGTDFAREARQQKILAAIQAKLFSREILLSPKRLLALKNIVVGSIETDLNQNEKVILGRRVLNGRKSWKSLILPEEFLINPPISPRYDNQYVFIPKAGSWEVVQGWIEEKLR